MINALFWRIAGLSLACSAVLLPLLLASRLIRRRYSARTCYALWLLLALRLLLPVSVTPPARTVTVEVPQYEVALPTYADTSTQAVSAKPQDPAQNGAVSPNSAIKSAAPSISLTKLLPVLWVAGMVCYGLWLAAAYALTRRVLVKNAVSADSGDEALMEVLSRELNCKRRPALYRTDRVRTPMLLGLFRPVVLLPEGEMPEEELALMLRHELTHLRRGDVAYKLFLQLVCAVHWFNPLVWWMSREAGQDLELCCDEDVVRGRDGAFRRTYGDILLKTAAEAGGAPILSARMGGGKGHLKVRLSNLFVKKKKGTALVCIALAAAILGGSLVACTGETPEQKLDEDLEAAVLNGDWKAVVTSFQNSTDPAELQKRQELLDAIRESHAELEDSLLNYLAIQELVDSVSVDYNGKVSFTIPAGGQGQSEWDIELKGRMEADGIGGMSIHHSFDRVELVPGVECSFAFSKEQWAGIKELYLSVKLGEESRDVDLWDASRTDVPLQTGEGAARQGNILDGLSEACYFRDKGGAFGDDVPGDGFYINLKDNGTFTYYVGVLSSYIGMGEWTQEGDTLCLADHGLQDKTNYFYFQIVDGALLFQKDKSAEFAYVDVADGERFSSRPIKPAYYEPAEE